MTLHSKDIVSTIISKEKLATQTFDFSKSGIPATAFNQFLISFLGASNDFLELTGLTSDQYKLTLEQYLYEEEGIDVGILNSIFDKSKVLTWDANSDILAAEDIPNKQLTFEDTIECYVGVNGPDHVYNSAGAKHVVSKLIPLTNRVVDANFHVLESHVVPRRFAPSGFTDAAVGIISSAGGSAASTGAIGMVATKRGTKQLAVADLFMYNEYHLRTSTESYHIYPFISNITWKRVGAQAVMSAMLKDSGELGIRFTAREDDGFLGELQSIITAVDPGIEPEKDLQIISVDPDENINAIQMEISYDGTTYVPYLPGNSTIRDLSFTRSFFTKYLGVYYRVITLGTDSSATQDSGIYKYPSKIKLTSCIIKNGQNDSRKYHLDPSSAIEKRVIQLKTNIIAFITATAGKVKDGAPNYDEGLHTYIPPMRIFETNREIISSPLLLSDKYYIRIPFIDLPNIELNEQVTLSPAFFTGGKITLSDDSVETVVTRNTMTVYGSKSDLTLSSPGLSPISTAMTKSTGNIPYTANGSIYYGIFQVPNDPTALTGKSAILKYKRVASVERTNRSGSGILLALTKEQVEMIENYRFTPSMEAVVDFEKVYDKLYNGDEAMGYKNSYKEELDSIGLAKAEMADVLRDAMHLGYNTLTGIEEGSTDDRPPTVVTKFTAIQVHKAKIDALSYPARTGKQNELAVIKQAVDQEPIGKGDSIQDIILKSSMFYKSKPPRMYDIVVGTE